MPLIDDLNAAATIQDGSETVIVANAVYSITVNSGVVTAYDQVVDFNGEPVDENGRVYIAEVIYELTLDGSNQVTAYRIIEDAEGIPTLADADNPVPVEQREATGGAYGEI